MKRFFSGGSGGYSSKKVLSRPQQLSVFPQKINWDKVGAKRRECNWNLFYAACHEVTKRLDKAEWEDIEMFSWLNIMNNFNSWDDFRAKGFANLGTNRVECNGRRHGNMSSFQAFSETLDKEKYSCILVDLSREELEFFEETGLPIFQKYDGSLERIRSEATDDELITIQGHLLSEDHLIYPDEFRENAHIALDEIYAALHRGIEVIPIDVDLKAKKECFEAELSGDEQIQAVLTLWCIVAGVPPSVEKEEDVHQYFNLQKQISMQPELFDNIPSIFLLSNILLQQANADRFRAFVIDRLETQRRLLHFNLAQYKDTTLMIYSSPGQIFHLWNDVQVAARPKSS